MPRPRPLVAPRIIYPHRQFFLAYTDAHYRYMRARGLPPSWILTPEQVAERARLLRAREQALGDSQGAS